MELSGLAGYFVLLTRLALFLLTRLTLGKCGQCSSATPVGISSPDVLMAPITPGKASCDASQGCVATAQAIPPPPRRRPDHTPSRRKYLIHVAHPPFFFLIPSNLLPRPRAKMARPCKVKRRDYLCISKSSFANTPGVYH